MRRSAAPSQLSVKRQKFNPPLIKLQPEAALNRNKIDSKENDNDEAGSSVNQVSRSGEENTKDCLVAIGKERSLKDVLSLLNKQRSPHDTAEVDDSCEQCEERIDNDVKKGEAVMKVTPKLHTPSTKSVPRFKPVHTVPPATNMTNIEQKRDSKTDGATDCAGTSYWNVVWCKVSKKKHKKWEGDAVLLTKARSVTLLDLDGKQIGKGTGYKTSELQSLNDGSTLVIGGKEIEVMGSISSEDFTSGKCFNAAGSTSEKDVVISDRMMSNKARSTPFILPGKLQESKTVVAVPTEVKPRHDPSNPGALVLPRPPAKHQWEFNKSSAQIVDLVVDPYLSQHLRPHQREGVVFLYQCIMGMKNYTGQGVILADEMGLGKTLQCICLIWTLLKQGPYGGKPVVKKVLVVTPGSLVKNWVKEFKKWLGTERIKVFAVTQDNKIQDFAHLPHHPVCIISYEMLVRTIDQIRQQNFDLVVCDEGHRLKNSNIKTASFLSSLTCRRRVVLTGTPVQNDLQELYSIVEFCNPNVLGTSSAFRRVYEEPILAAREPGADSETLKLGEERGKELNRITAMFILRRTADINNKYLPPKVEMVLFCKPSHLQLQLYNQLINCRALRSCFTSRDAGQHLMCISSLKRLCNHPALLYDNALEAQNTATEDKELYRDLLPCYPADFDPCVVSPDDSGKLEVVCELLRALYHSGTQERVVLVSNYTQTLDIFEKWCVSQNYQFLRLDGQTPTDKRQQLVETFNNRYGQHFVFLLSCKAGGVGLNLIGASRLILYDIDWNPANDLQAMARVWRDGQKKKVYIYRLLTTGTIEEKMYQRQVSKQGLSGVVVDARSSSTKQCFSPEELRDLFTLQEATLCATHDLLGCTDCTTVTSQHPPVRPCRLDKSSTKKNLCMDELLEWRHISGPSVNITQLDPVLGEHGPLTNVTYLFWNESNKMVPSTCD